MKLPEFNERNATMFARLYLEMVDRISYSEIVDDVNSFYRQKLRVLNERFPMTERQFENLIEDVKFELEGSFRHYFRNNTSCPETLIEAMNFSDWAAELWERIYEKQGEYTLPKTSTFVVESPQQKQVIWLQKIIRTPSDPGARGNGSSGLAATPLH